VTGDWPEKRHEVADTEARAVIEAQNVAMADIDDKAMRTVRLNAVLLGLLGTGTRFAPSIFEGWLLAAAFLSLVGSTVCGVVTYNESNIYVGPRGEYVETLATEQFQEPPWAVHLLETMAGMMATNVDVLRRNARWLTATQATLVVGVVAAVAAVVF
jgi:hypothetical protein